jgi:hypothetical protein
LYLYISYSILDDLSDNLENYLRTKEHAEELDAKIEQTDRLSDEIVYELYGLTREDIETVQGLVGLTERVRMVIFGRRY